MVKPSSLPGSESAASSQSHHSVARVHQTYVDCPFLAHLLQDGFGTYFIVYPSVPVEPVFIFCQYPFMFRHVYHVGEVEEQRYRFPAVDRPYSHPVPRRAAVLSGRISSEQVEPYVPSVPDFLQFFPVRVI